MPHPDDIKTNEDIAMDINTEIQALGVNLERKLSSISFLLFLIFILGVVALIHFW